MCLRCFKLRRFMHSFGEIMKRIINISVNRMRQRTTTTIHIMLVATFRLWISILVCGTADGIVFRWFFFTKNGFAASFSHKSCDGPPPASETIGKLVRRWCGISKRFGMNGPGKGSIWSIKGPQSRPDRSSVKWNKLLKTRWKRHCVDQPTIYDWK